VNETKSEFFSSVGTFFLRSKAQGEKEWGGIISKYGKEPYFGRMLRQAGHVPTVLPGRVHQEIQIPLYWNYDFVGGFYFNALGADLKEGEFEELKTRFTLLLGKPDEVFSFYALDEPRWESSDVSLRLYHVDSHGGGYERIGLEIPISFVSAGT
jgi:hypothetical protein